MRDPRLVSLTVENFRSIRGRLTVPLDAPVVLVHGHNGAGKTSLLSAIELALTGRVASLSAAERKYELQLVNKVANRGAVDLQAVGAPSTTGVFGAELTQEGLRSRGVLQVADARFYSERCHLAQSTLGRLLEIYQFADGKSGKSPLTTFVKELLQLDQLDALIDGLHDAGDVRRVRNSVPEYARLRESIASLERRVSASESERAPLEREILRIRNSLLDDVASLEADVSLLQSTMDGVRSALENVAEEQALQELARVRRELVTLRDRWSTSLKRTSSRDDRDLELEEVRTRDVLDAWNSWVGAELLAITTELESMGVAQRLQLSSRPSAVHEAATSALEAEIQRLTGYLESRAEVQTLLRSERRSIERLQSQIAEVTVELTKLGSDAGDLATALAALLPHVAGELCPVCERDFRDVSTVPLAKHLAARINAIADNATRIKELIEARTSAERELSASALEVAKLESRTLSKGEREELESRRSNYGSLLSRLNAISDAMQMGDDANREAEASKQALLEWRGASNEERELRPLLFDLSQRLNIVEPSLSESVEQTFQRMEDLIASRESELASKQRVRRRLLENFERYMRERERLSLIEESLSSTRRRLEELRGAELAAEAEVARMRQLSKAALAARATIVQRVFNESLNHIWRDLFVRMAPEEPFVPRFAIPDSTGGAIEAVLGTLYRGSILGGNPRAMLSAGNLNTAALTLFLALHLSAAPILPWLVIDDPVQSMDEVHIAQFAALLRTLTKQHGRQVILAVHERPLFEYLRLELSPSFEGDKLITVELSRSINESTRATVETLDWEQDPAFFAA